MKLRHAYAWAIVLGAVTVVALFPADTWSFIDGGPETWTRTVIGWSYRVPEGTSEWFPEAAAIVAGILVGPGALMCRSVGPISPRPLQSTAS